MLNKQLKIGIIGMSEGNGHPYSWAAIFNGYDEQYMQDCPFSVIPEYLAKQKFPKDAIPNAKVTHIWTQSLEISTHIAQAALIENIVENPEDMIGEVDAILLARDDAKNHYQMSHSFLNAGIPVYIDKPLSISLKDANKILSNQKYEGQVFTCSALRYAEELLSSQIQSDKVGKLKFIDATIPKSWEKYAVHIIEPVLSLIPERGHLVDVSNSGQGETNIVTVRWENEVQAVFKVLGSTVCPLSIRVFGEKGHQELTFKDTFSAFKNSLIVFIEVVKQKRVLIPRKETLEIVEIIERGFQKQLK